MKNKFPLLVRLVTAAGVAAGGVLKFGVGGSSETFNYEGVDFTRPSFERLFPFGMDLCREFGKSVADFAKAMGDVESPSGSGSDFP